MYNDWFMKFAPKAFRETRIETTKAVEATLHSTFKAIAAKLTPGALVELQLSGRLLHHDVEIPGNLWDRHAAVEQVI